MLKEILAVSGRPGLYKLVSRGKGTLIVESLVDGKRRPAYGSDHVSALGDISIYTSGGDDKPLPEVLEALKVKTGGKPVDMAALKEDSAARRYFEEVMPDFDQDRVHTSDIRKLLSWYNILLNAGMTDFVKAGEEEKPEQEEEKQAPKE